MDIAHIHFILALLATLNPIWKVGQRNNSKLLNIEWIYLIAVIKWKSIGNARVFEGVYCMNVVFHGTHSLPHLMPLKWVLFYSKTEISRIEHLNHKFFTGATFSPFLLTPFMQSRDVSSYCVTQHQTHIVHITLCPVAKNNHVRVFHLFSPFW